MMSDFKSLRNQCLQSGELYEDPDFPASVRSLFFNGDSSDIVWRRPSKIVQSESSQDLKFIDKGATRFDLHQGQLGDCWFIAAVASLATNGWELLSRVVPDDQNFNDGQYAGIFRFHFWHYGEWKEVIIDDQLPTYRYSKTLPYASNKLQANEFWVPLLEKAYAKYYGCYDALQGGNISVALMDMTGGITEMIEMNNADVDPDDLFDLLNAAFQMNSLMGGAKYQKTNSIREYRETNGLYQGHAYSITKVLEVTNYFGRKVKLLRLRNPWGEGEWNGPWSDNSSEWRRLSISERKEVGLIKENDGEFWMDIDDVIRHFDVVDLCHLDVDAYSEELSKRKEKNRWQVTSYRDGWVRGVSAGGPRGDSYWKNPQFRLIIGAETNESTVVISLIEIESLPMIKDRRISIGFDVYKVLPGTRQPLETDSYNRNALSLKETSGIYWPYRERTLRLTLKPGTYVIIPSTFRPNDETEFMLRIYSDLQLDTSPIEEPTGPINGITLSEASLIENIFNAVASPYPNADAFLLKAILDKARQEEFGVGDGFSLELCRSLLAVEDKNGFGNVTVTQIEAIWKNIKRWQQEFRELQIGQTNQIYSFMLGTALNRVGFSINRKTIISVVRRYATRENKIGLEDFLLIAAKVFASFASFQKKSGSADGNGTVQFNLSEWVQSTLSL